MNTTIPIRTSPRVVGPLAFGPENGPLAAKVAETKKLLQDIAKNHATDSGRIKALITAHDAEIVVIEGAEKH